MTTIVIGAGLAGLSAALELADAGVDVLVLEARDRVGGRVWSERLSNGAVIERGGEYIFPSEHSIRGLAARFALPFVSHGVLYERRSIAGKRITWRELLDREDRVHTAAANVLETHHNASVADAFSTGLGSGYVDDPYFRRFVTSAAADPSLISARTLLSAESSPTIDDAGHLLDGNQSLPNAIASWLGNRVRLNAIVTEIALTAEGATVVCADGSVNECDTVVLATPLAQVEPLTRHLPVPRAMRDSLAQKAMADATKISIPLANSVVDSAVQSQTAFSWTWQSRSVDGETRVPALTGFAGAESAGRYAGPDGGSRWGTDLEELRPGLEPAGEPLLTAWGADPWTRGCYTYRALGWRPSDDLAFDQLVAERIAMAGEYTLEGTMNEAVLSGQRAARLILQAVRAKRTRA